MEAVRVRNVAIGSGMPKICVSIIEKTGAEILRRAGELVRPEINIIEWRLDWFGDVGHVDKVVEMTGRLRGQLGDMPLLATFRTAAEGGEKALGIEKYKELTRTLIESGNVDLIDVELLLGADVVAEIVREAHVSGVKVIVSNHDFQKTPSKEEIVSRLRRMQELGADIPKIAVMPRSRRDVLTLLEATLEMHEKYAKTPIITMSMKGDGVVSRMAGEVFGSALTFGACGQASAPGQMEVSKLQGVLSALHESLVL